MKSLADCPCSVERTARNAWRGTLQEPKGGVALEVTAESPFALHLIDADTLIAKGERCDGVLVAETPPSGVACFIELKGALDASDPDHPFRQLLGGMAHFAPLPDGTPHGEEHHSAWRAGNDLAEAAGGRGRPKALNVAGSHAVAGAVVVVRGGSRQPGRWVRVAGRDVFIAVIQRHGERGRVAITLEELEAAIAVDR